MAAKFEAAIASLSLRNDEAAPAQGGEQPAEKATVDPVARGWTKDLDNHQVKGEAIPDDGLPLWASGAQKYEWKEEFGDVAPQVPELEKQLFRNQHILRRGKAFENLELSVTQESETQIRPINEFADAGLHPVMLENVKLCEYDRPTPIQGYCIPAILQNHDLIAVAQTGSGKTASFLVPILSKLMGKAKKLRAARPHPSAPFDPKAKPVMAEPLVLIIAPTRELSVQIFDETRRLCYRSMLRPCVAYGGGPRRDQESELRRGCDILIGTPGRLIDFMSRGDLLTMRRVRYTVIDEADELVSPDWADDMRRILSGGDISEDGDHRFMMFSATFPKGARELAKEFLQDDNVRITVGRLGSTHKNIAQQVLDVVEENKRECIRDLLLSLKPTRTIVFTNSKKSADFLDDYLFTVGFPSTSIHSDRSQREREDALRAFRTSKAPILVTTGVAARGLDISNVMHIINFDLPRAEHGGITEYKHRIGRTARMGNQGLATSFFNERDEALGPLLVQCLVDNDQHVPPFLENFRPAEGERHEEEDAFGGGGEAAADAGWGAAEEGAGGDDWGQGGAEQTNGGGPEQAAGGASDGKAGGGDGWDAAPAMAKETDDLEW